MTASLWMTTNQVAEESGRHRDSVLDALNRKLLTGTQSHPLARWRIRRSDFTKWMDAGAPIDTPRKARIRRSA